MRKIKINIIISLIIFCTAVSTELKASWLSNLWKNSNNTSKQELSVSLVNFLRFYDESLNKFVSKKGIVTNNRLFIDGYTALVKNYVHNLNDKQTNEILNKVKQSIVKKIKNNKLYSKNPINISNVAMHQLYNSLDPHTSWFSAKQYTEFKHSMTGEYEGVGMVLMKQKKSHYVVVTRVIENSPAFKAGIKKKDLIYKVNHTLLKNKSLIFVANQLKGVKGSKLKLGIKRNHKYKYFNMTRSKILLKSVESKIIDGKYAYIKVNAFNKNTTYEFRKSLKKLNINKTQGIVLDLRNNPGGYLYSALIISNMFLNEGTILSVKGRDKQDYMTYKALKNVYVKQNIPMVILVNNMTASAAEIVSAALSQNGRAIILGQRSFGKGSVQALYELKGGSAAKITIQLFFTPNGEPLQGIGVAPDILIEPIKKSPFYQLREKKFKNIIYIKHTLKPKHAMLKIKAKNCKVYTKDNDHEIGCAIKYLLDQKLIAKIKNYNLLRNKYRVVSK